MGVLGLGSIIIGEDVAHGALLGRSNQSAALTCFTDGEPELSGLVISLLVNLFPSALLPCVNLPMMLQP